MTNCPNCGSEEIDRDEVDIGVGIQYGPYGCMHCGWSEDSYWDKSKGPAPAEKDYPGFHTDPRGGVTRKNTPE